MDGTNQKEEQFPSTTSKNGRQMDERYHDQDSRSTVILVLSWSSHGGNNNVVGLAFSVEVVVAAVTGYL